MEDINYSFIIPSYNDAEGLLRHLNYFSQRTEKIQMVIIDDCSTDNTETLVSTAKTPENIKLTYHRQGRNCGPASARNKGLDLASNDYIMFLDADDILADCFFDYAALAPLENGADFVMFKYHLATSSNSRYTYEMHKNDNKFFTSTSLPSSFPSKTYTLEQLPSALNTTNFPWNKLYRRDFLKRANLQFPDLRMHEDITPHWHSFMRADRFSVLSWAPPLITHFETKFGGRATNYVGPDRLGVFPELKLLFKEIQSHPLADTIAPQFHAFCDDMFSWMTGPLCDGATKNRSEWRAKYLNEVDLFRSFLQGNETIIPTCKNDLPLVDAL